LIDGAPQLADLWVAGQISNFHRASSGHWYFTLLDDESELRCVMWKGVAARVGSVPTQGDMVDAHGYISVYERGGSYQFYVDALEPAGISTLWEEFSRLRARLEAEGLFDASRKRPVPVRPRRIGLVTSPSGAALQDILRVLSVRYPLVEVVLSPTLVQGQEAPAGIVRALERLDRIPDVDVIIVARGGGSLEDLWSFNDERVARAIAGARVPVVSGVGHETDITIADMVADLRMPTPTAAASAVVPDGLALRARIADSYGIMHAEMDRRIVSLRRELDQQLRLLRTLHPRRLIAEKRQRLDDRLERLTAHVQHDLSLRRAELSARTVRLSGLDTRRVLGRGYAIVQIRATGERLGSVSQVKPQDDLIIALSDGQVDAEVVETHTRGLTFNAATD
ncbi:MAG: exodeoxyribonuclease VII large subunit, partial [Anaerolineae bacterium]